jgi:four helix bundle protein
VAFAKTFRDLDVYQNALKLVVDVHAFCDTLPAKEKYVLADQMRRASRSVCSNIAEAWRKRRYQAAFVSKLSDAETEASEMQSWLDVAKALDYMRSNLHKDFDARYEQVIGQLVTMISHVNQWCTM